MTSIHTAYGGTLSLTTSPMTVGWIFSISIKYEQAITAESGTLRMIINGREQRF
jgi:hypothetical protein